MELFCVFTRAHSGIFSSVAEIKRPHVMKDSHNMGPLFIIYVNDLFALAYGRYVRQRLLLDLDFSLDRNR